MSAPIRSASVSPFAAARPQVHSRRVSLRVGAFGLTYSTNSLRWDAAPETPTAADPAPVDPAPAIESERQQPQSQASTFPADLETARRLSLWASAQEQAARQQTVDGQAGGRQQPEQQNSGQQGSPGQAAGQGEGQAPATPDSGSGPVAPSQARPDQAHADLAQGELALAGQSQTGQYQTERLAEGISGEAQTGSAQARSAETEGAGVLAGPSLGQRALAQAMRRATQAYQACQAGLAGQRPMLQAVA